MTPHQTRKMKRNDLWQRIPELDVGEQSGGARVAGKLNTRVQTYHGPLASLLQLLGPDFLMQPKKWGKDILI